MTDITVERFDSSPERPTRVRIIATGEEGVIASQNGSSGRNFNIGPNRWLRAEWIYLEASNELRMCPEGTFDLIREG